MSIVQCVKCDKCGRLARGLTPPKTWAVRHALNGDEIHVCPTCLRTEYEKRAAR